MYIETISEYCSHNLFIVIPLLYYHTKLDNSTPTPFFMSSTKDTTTQYRCNTHYQYNVTSVYSYIYYILLYIGTMLIHYVTVKAKIYGHIC